RAGRSISTPNMRFDAIRPTVGPSRWCWWPGPPYIAIKGHDDGERQDSWKESAHESGFDDECSTSRRPATSFWSAMNHALLLASAMFTAAFLGTRSAIVVSKSTCPRQDSISSRPVESPMLSKGTRIPFLENGTSTVTISRWFFGADSCFEVPSKPSNFTPHEILGLPATIESNKAWDALIGPNGLRASKGYIEIAHPERYGLPPGVTHPSDSSKGIYGLAMTHELHCLVGSEVSRDERIRIRTAFYDVVEGRLTPEDFHSPPRREVTKLLALDHGALHLNHCFDYLQEGIRCAAHLDVQYPVMHAGAGILTGERMCKDWDAVLGILEDNSFDASNMTL
ncbi:Phenylalanine aminomutase (L-beta-phenylalanine forming), partial [Pseudocercospora fuligena]